MKAKLFACTFVSSLTIGLGIGFGLAASDKPLVLEANNTPVGSFVLRYNVADTDPVLPFTLEEDEQPIEYNHIA